ncbi:AAA family ATPase [Spongisporangium articulatum]|uniref:AAA family ATPase n=1 Tax=Spongisporangium articulatum TaxID=3362603 RepID=A0ABW8APQ4_9ACTN
MVAGPNGVGKTRLLQHILNTLRGANLNPGSRIVIEATVEAERTAWGKSLLDLTDPVDLNILRATLQANRTRRNWSSSLVNFESNRTIQNLQPLSFSWDMQDPAEEVMSWDLTFNAMKDRFQDTVHAMYRMIEAQRGSIATRAIQLRRQGHEEMRLQFADPMEPFKEVFTTLLGPKSLVDPSPRTQRLEFKVNDSIFDFDALSSGEREVVNIAFDFLLRKPTDCIVFFDEPELHLHPELSYKMLQALQTIGERNQFILTTHSPDIITSSLDHTVIFLAPPKLDAAGAFQNQAIPVSETDETNQALQLLGQSIGIISLGRRIVLIEGLESSLDKQTYGSIIRDRHPELVLVPSGGKSGIKSFETVYKNILEKTMWGVDFFMLVDGDTEPAGTDEKTKAQEQDRLRVLPRYHLENYFLDENVWARIFRDLDQEDSKLADPVEVRELLSSIARDVLSYACALKVSHDLRLAVGNASLMPKNAHNKTVNETVSLILERAQNETARINDVLSDDKIQEHVARIYAQLERSLDSGEEWKRLIPGKPILGRFASQVGLTLGRAKNLYVREATRSNLGIFDEILDIFDTFSK